MVCRSVVDMMRRSTFSPSIGLRSLVVASVATGCGFWLLVVVFVLVAVEASVIAVGVEVTFDFSSAIVLVGVVDSNHKYRFQPCTLF